MLKGLSEEEIKDQYELYNRIKNKTRKALLIFLYQNPRNYRELADYTQLKPGSLYHHLSVLEPLISKINHGQYEITTLGKTIVESMNFVEGETRKPTINKISPSDDDSSIQKQKVQKIEKIHKESKIDSENNHFPDSIAMTSNKLQTSSETLLTRIWLSPTSYFLLVLTLLVVIFLGNEDVTFAGSAIYGVKGSNTYIIDLFAFFIGVGSLYIIEELMFQYPIYDRLRFISTIRLISMLPSLVIGLVLLLLFYTNVIPTQSIYPVIFTLGIILGTLLAASGIHFLRGQSFADSILIAVVPGIIDLLFGIVILLS